MTPPSSSYNDAPARQICVNEEWLSHVIGRLWALEKESWWSSDGYDASQQITELVDTWSNQDCVMPFIMPVSTVIMWGGEWDDAIPDGWLLCDGSEVSREDYADLFAVIGEKFGEGDNATTFNVPDMRFRVPIGANPTGNDEVGFDILETGATGGSANVTLDESEIPAHSHQVIYYAKYSRNQAGSNGSWGWLGTSPSGDFNTGDAGGGLPHNNLQPFKAFTFLIKA